MINTDLSINNKWVARRNTENTFTLTFTSSGAFNISAYTFVLNFKRVNVDYTVMQLTQGAGITNGGASGILTVNLSEANSDLLANGDYFYELRYTVASKTYTLFNGVLYLYNQMNIDSDPSPEFNATVMLGTSEVTLAFAA